MIFAATLAALTLSPIVAGEKLVAYEAKAEMAGARRTVLVAPKHAEAVMAAIQSGAGQKLIVRREGSRNVLVGSQDADLKASLAAADLEDRAAKRAADPLGYALGDLAFAEQMLRCVRADVVLHEEAAANPEELIARYEARVADLKKIVLDLDGASQTTTVA